MKTFVTDRLTESLVGLEEKRRLVAMCTSFTSLVAIYKNNSPGARRAYHAPPRWGSILFILFTVSIQIFRKIMAPRKFRGYKG